ncbi:MAG: hypothetical protein LH650_13085, partial [Chloroflexi bacterium]|nr:hypothetical protein [Chloroflexota bacterium]
MVRRLSSLPVLPADLASDLGIGRMTLHRILDRAGTSYEAVLGTGPGASRAESTAMASDLIPRTGGGITPTGGASGFPCPGDEAADP